MAQLQYLCFASPITSFPLLEPHSFSQFPSLSLSSTKPIFLSLRRTFRLTHISSSASATLATQNPPSETPSEKEEICPTRLLATNIPWTATADDIRALFQNYGTVVDVELSMHSKTKNRGLAFVEMGSVEEAAQALAKLEAYEFEGRPLRIAYAMPKKKKESPPEQPKPAVVYNLFVANLSFSARSRDLKELFQSGGIEVAKAEVIFNEKPRKSSGYGFVSFKTKKEADDALTAFEGKVLMGRPIKLARSNRFVKLESELNSLSEDGEDTAADSSLDSEQTETVDSL
ncbi:RNA-binding protein CP29B, chloroplastic [Spinacia oleracea]|uniref:RNA-binding protein CP29B, chloroplastic n=1 Tax=Spinacia oleracea TaxID=3562 RepID=A0A9R0JC47_SPIOL|nr:RNA-binding protein CP29B, chloroplastic [Spinacia oleracea]